MKTNSPLGRCPIWLLLTALSLPLLTLHAGYRQVGHPDIWKLDAPTPIYSLDNPGERIETLRKNIEVEVLDVDVATGHWTIRYRPTGDNPIIGNMQIPDLSVRLGAAFSSVKPLIEEFPLLKTILESDQAWRERIDELRTSFQKDSAISVWNTEAPKAVVSEDETGPILSLLIWDKEKDDPSRTPPSIIKAMLAKNLSKLERAFRLNHFHILSTSAYEEPDAEITSWVLPNDIVATVSYLPRDHLTLIFESFDNLQAIQPEPPDPYEIADRMKARKYTSAGHLYLAGVPLGEGGGGYGPNAALACAMAYYGCPPADRRRGFSSFENISAGSGYEEINRVFQRFSIGTPLQLNSLEQDDGYSFETIRDSIEAGNPILLFAPEGMLLIIGFHPESREMLFYDSWKRNSAMNTMSWEDLNGLHPQLWVLTP